MYPRMVKKIEYSVFKGTELKPLAILSPKLFKLESLGKTRFYWKMYPLRESEGFLEKE